MPAIGRDYQVLTPPGFIALSMYVGIPPLCDCRTGTRIPVQSTVLKTLTRHSQPGDDGRGTGQHCTPCIISPYTYLNSTATRNNNNGERLLKVTILPRVFLTSHQFPSSDDTKQQRQHLTAHRTLQKQRHLNMAGVIQPMAENETDGDSTFGDTYSAPR
jgi:hypothetical protein